jgi:hypothetical protein
MKKLGIAALLALPFLGGCYDYYPRPCYGSYYYHPRRVWVAPAPVVVAPPPRAYW